MLNNIQLFINALNYTRNRGNLYMTIQQLELLLAIYLNGSSTLKKLSTSLGMTQSSVSRNTQLLANNSNPELQFITIYPDPSDKRRKIVEFIEKGKEFIKGFLDIFEGNNKQIKCFAEALNFTRNTFNPKMPIQKLMFLLTIYINKKTTLKIVTATLEMSHVSISRNSQAFCKQNHTHTTNFIKIYPDREDLRRKIVEFTDEGLKFINQFLNILNANNEQRKTRLTLKSQFRLEINKHEVQQSYTVQTTTDVRNCINPHDK